jgi:Kef-type K+ transport system membrane component KefB/nucleotide-binding universal stress UspA family protein
VDNSKRRLAFLYLLLFAVLGVVVVFVLAVGGDAKAQPGIAGGYDARPGGSPCLGPRFDVKQSGQFVTIKAAGDAGGNLRLEDGHVTGDVTCVGGDTAALDLLVAGTALEGQVGGRDLAADLKRDAPTAGSRVLVPGSITGEYKVAPRSECVGGRFEIEGGHGKLLDLVAKGAEGTLTYDDGKISGSVACKGGGPVADLTGEAVNRTLTLTIGDERVQAEKQREFGHTLAALFIVIAIVMLVARLAGAAMVRLGQPRVMGEVLAGIALGPTLLGRIAPEVQASLFPVDVIPYVGAAANLGLIFYMFLIGLELDFSQLKGRVSQTAAISNAGVVLPMAVGLLVAVPVYELVAPDVKFLGFALFMGVAMSITAFPVLARILVERRMLKRPVGAIALAAAAVDDVSAWFLIAFASAVATASGASGVVQTIALAIAFCLGMAFLVRPLLARVSVAYDEAGRVPTAWITAIFAGVLLSAYATETIGIALIFGAFIMGAIMPRRAELTEDVTRRIEDFVVMLLLPLFFAYTGLRTDVGLLERPELILLTLVLLAVAIFCKFGGAMFASRMTGLGWRESAVIGSLMNTRGLTELIVLNLALEKGVISEALFAALVLMALATTFMTGPLLKLLDPKNRFGAPLSEELEDARKASIADSPIPVPEQSILVAPQAEAALPQLLALVEPLARSEPPRELILARLVEPSGSALVRGGLQTQDKRLNAAWAEMERTRQRLLKNGVAARAVAFTSLQPGRDLAELASSEEVDLVIMDGRRPLLGEGVPRGPVGEVLARAPCDVAVLVAREDSQISLGDARPVIVPFSGAEHDWAALELGAWIAAANGAPLKLLGSAGTTDEGRDATRLLGNASLVVQQFAGIPAQPLVADPGAAGLIAAASDAGLLVVGLSERWRKEGLGETRSEIARHAPAPVLFVRRGLRPGALAPKGDVTRFTWSSPGHGPLMMGGG